MSYSQSFADPEFAAWSVNMCALLDRKESAWFYYYSTQDLEFRLQTLRVNYPSFSQVKIINLLHLSLESPEEFDQLCTLEDSPMCVIGVERLLTEWSPDHLRILEKHAALKQYSLFLFSQQPIFEPAYASLHTYIPSFLRSAHVIPLHSDEVTTQFIEYRADVVSVPLPKKIAQRIVQLAGGHFWLAKQLVASFAKGCDVLGNCLDEPSVYYKVHGIFASLAPLHQQVMKSIVSGFDLSQDEKRALHFLQESGWVTASHKPAIRSQLLMQYILETFTMHHSIITVDGELVLNGVPITTMFSATECAVLTYLIQHKNEPVGKEEIAKIMWSKNWDERYSEWAIARLVDRIRLRLTSLKIPEKTIQTVRAVGYQYVD